MLNITEETLHLLKVNYSHAGFQTSASCLLLLFSIVGFHYLRLNLAFVHSVDDLLLRVFHKFFRDSGKKNMYRYLFWSTCNCNGDIKQIMIFFFNHENPHQFLWNTHLIASNCFVSFVKSRIMQSSPMSSQIALVLFSCGYACFLICIFFFQFTGYVSFAICAAFRRANWNSESAWQHLIQGLETTCEIRSQVML